MQSDRTTRESAAALVIVLAFVVLLTGVTLAYFSRAVADRDASSGAANRTRADILARSALDIVVASFKQEMAVGSAGAPPNYTPGLNRNYLPEESGLTATRSAAPNLVRISVRSDPILSPAVSSNASAIGSDQPSLNNRLVSKARWNAAYLIPKANAGDDSEPIAGFSAPDWVLVTPEGPSPFTAWDVGLKDPLSNKFALGRYAYAVYDEGGLLDVNVAGFPSTFTAAQVGPKGVLTFADLITTGVSSFQVDNLIGWRNFGTLKPGGYFSSTSTAGNSRFLPFNGLVAYFDAVTLRTNDFLKVSNATHNSKTDQVFISRQQLIKLRRSLGFSINSLQNFGTFSREINLPKASSAPNPAAPARFALSRIGWLSTAGVVAPGTAESVKSAFGLQWRTPPTGEPAWEYTGNTGDTALGAFQPIDATLGPDFFQLLSFGTGTTSVPEILSLGAAIIDQYDTDLNTTTITYASGLKAFGMDTNAPTDALAPPRPSGFLPVVLNRAFRSVGELGYAYKNFTQTVIFSTDTGTNDGRLLDLFSYSEVGMRAGSINLNTRNPTVFASMIKGATEKLPASYFPATRASVVAQAIINATSTSIPTGPAKSRADIPRLSVSAVAGLGGSDEEKEVVARALADVSQTRTWGLLVDVIAQSGRYPPNATSLANFVVEGEKRYWLHIAIDRFTGEVIDQQLEAVYE